MDNYTKEQLKELLDKTGYEFPLFELTRFDRYALKKARKKILRRKVRWVCLALPFWAFTTRRKIQMVLGIGATLESTYPYSNFLTFYNHPIEMKILWIDTLLEQEE